MRLEVRNYTKIIKNQTILDHVNLSFSSGHVYGFYGKNGSGKTMLFRAISTLIFPSEGDVCIDGESIIHNSFDLSQIGILMDHINFYNHLSGFDNLMMLYQINHKKNKEHILSMLDRVGLMEAKDKKFKEYSLGMKQRLNLAQAFMENQQIIILDEPTNGIDEKGLDIIYNFIKEEKAKGKLILMASHNKEDLAALCDEIYLVKAGTFTKMSEDVNLL